MWFSSVCCKSLIIAQLEHLFHSVGTVGRWRGRGERKIWAESYIFCADSRSDKFKATDWSLFGIKVVSIENRIFWRPPHQFISSWVFCGIHFISLSDTVIRNHMHIFCCIGNKSSVAFNCTCRESVALSHAKMIQWLGHGHGMFWLPARDSKEFVILPRKRRMRGRVFRGPIPAHFEILVLLWLQRADNSASRFLFLRNQPDSSNIGELRQLYFA